MNCKQWNYLRARGEYLVFPDTTRDAVELPPRTRRILNPMHKSLNTQGTTSAHAENTWSASPPLRYCSNYLRTRGEYATPLPVFMF